MNIANLTAKELRQAASIKDKIQVLEKALGKFLGSAATIVPGAPRRKRKKMSASARAKIGKAQKARWAKLKAKQGK